MLKRLIASGAVSKVQRITMLLSLELAVNFSPELHYLQAKLLCGKNILLLIFF